MNQPQDRADSGLVENRTERAVLPNQRPLRLPERLPPDLTGEALVTWSLSWEQRTGFDSIPTIERIYDRRESGAIVCCWPGCDYARKNAEDMWLHVHFSAKHPRDKDGS